MSIKEQFIQDNAKILYNGKYLPDEFKKLKNGFFQEKIELNLDFLNEDTTIYKTEIKNEKSDDIETPLIYDIIKLLARIIEIVAIFSIIFTFLFGITKQSDLAMYPSINEGDLILFYRINKNYKIDDVVVYKYDGNTYFARVVAVERRYSKYYRKRIGNKWKFTTRR